MSKTRPAHVAPPTRKHLSRVERERRTQRIILIGAVGVALLVVVLIAAGIIDQVVVQPRQAVARVNGAPISTLEFQKAVRYQRYQLLNNYARLLQTRELFGNDPQTSQIFDQQIAQVQTQLSDPETLGRQVLNDLIDDQFIRQETARRGLTVGADEVEARVRELFSFFPDGTPTPTLTPSPFPTDPPVTVDPTRQAAWTPTPTLTPTATLTVTLTPTASPTVTPTQTPGPGPTASPTGTPRPTATPFTLEGYNTVVTSYTTDLREIADLSDADFRRFVESELYREKLTEALGVDVPASAEFIRARHILVVDEATAQDLSARLKAGEDFATLAAQFGTDGTAQEGGDLGWHDRDYYVEEFSEAAFSLPLNTISDPVQTQFGWHVIEVLAREERPLTASQIEEQQQQALQDWLEIQREVDPATGQPKNFEIYENVWSGRVPDRPSTADLVR